MDFPGLTTNSFVRWAASLPDSYHFLEYPQLWEGEPQSCIFQVTKIARGGEGSGEIEFDCVKDCGRHVISMLTAREYEEVSEALGEELFEHVESMEQFASVFVEPEQNESNEEEYDFDEDVDAIIQML